MSARFSTSKFSSRDEGNAAEPPRGRGSSLARDALSGRFGVVVGILLIMWVIEIADLVVPGDFSRFGIHSWDWSSIWTIVTAPFIHGSWGHLLANSVPFLILGCLVAIEGAAQFLWVTAVSTLVGGLGVFFVNSAGSLTVGSSILVFGYFGYLVAGGFIAPTWREKLGRLAIGLPVMAMDEP